jgi:pimeloyl-ACP methyl ester carboxylesterase
VPDSPLATWVAGPADAPPVVMVHPNPLDKMSWMYQVADLSTDHRCIAVDLPGYGESAAMPDSWGIRDIADAVWTVVDRHADGSRPAVVMGSSIGSHIVEHMYHLRPERTRALVLAGTGWDPAPAFIGRRVREYRERGISTRAQHAADIFSPAFRATSLCQWIVSTTCARATYCTAESISRLFEIRHEQEPDAFYSEIAAPTLIVSGTEDVAHQTAFALQPKIPGSQLVTIPGAGHACQLEQPWSFNSHVRGLLARC